MRDHPAGDVAAEDIQDDVEIEVGPLGGSEQLGDVPAPELIGSRRQPFRLLVGRMSELIAAFARFALLFQEAMHGANRPLPRASPVGTSRRPARAGCSRPGSPRSAPSLRLTGGST